MGMDEYKDYLRQLDSEHIVAFDRENEWSVDKLKSDINTWLRQIQQYDELFWILFDESPFDFLAKFLALNIANRTIVLPANDKPKTIQTLLDTYQGDIKCFNFEYDESSARAEDEVLELNFDTNILLYTSGSSGDSKKVTKTLALLINEVEILNELWGSDFKKVIATVSHQHLYGLLFRLLWPFFCGKSFLNKQLKYPEELQFGATDLALVTSPAILSRLDKNIEYGNFARVFSSGGPLNYESAKLSYELLKRWPLEIYGSTETGGIAYRTQVTVNAPWRLFPEVSLYSNKQGYSVRSKFIIEDFIMLDDKISMLDDETFNLDGRKDRVIKYEEKRLSLDQLERVLEECPWISSAKCLLLDSARKPLAAVLVLTKEGVKALQDKGKRCMVSNIRKGLLNSFELSVLPKKWRFVDELPTNSMNKVVIAELRDLFI